MMKIPVDEKNLKIMLTNIEIIFIVGEKIEPFTLLSIYKACFTNARAI